MLKTFVYQSPAFGTKFGNTLLATAEDKASAVQVMQKFIKGKGLTIPIEAKDVWALNEEVPQVTFVCGD